MRRFVVAIQRRIRGQPGDRSRETQESSQEWLGHPPKHRLKPMLQNPRCQPEGAAVQLADGVIHDLLCFTDDIVQVCFVFEAFGVDFADVFGAGGPGSKPAALRDNF
jgi:hypothetical protein